MAREHTPMPDWPRGMPLALAAQYCGIGTQTLANNGPKPVRIGLKRLVWLREDLDAWLDRLAGRPAAQAPADENNPWLIDNRYDADTPEYQPRARAAKGKNHGI